DTEENNSRALATPSTPFRCVKQGIKTLMLSFLQLQIDGNPTPTSGLVFRTVTLQARSDPLVSKPLTAEGRSPPFSAVY
ncbi:hypothetical protein A2U01_0029928, partial [Trifolium medium]|nr:hypothetical protein [Trifolium medium]